MSTRRPAATAKKVDGKTASPYGYPFWDWVAREDPEYVRARQPLSELSVGEGKELRGILAFRGREEGVPGGGPTFSTGVQALMKLERDGAFTKS